MTDYEWAPIPGHDPEAEAILAALKDRKEGPEPVKTMVLGDAAATRTENLVKSLRRTAGVSIISRHGKTYAEWAPERKRGGRGAKKGKAKLEAVKS